LGRPPYFSLVFNLNLFPLLFMDVRICFGSFLRHPSPDSDPVTRTLPPLPTTASPEDLFRFLRPFRRHLLPGFFPLSAWLFVSRCTFPETRPPPSRLGYRQRLGSFFFLSLVGHGDLFPPPFPGPSAQLSPQPLTQVPFPRLRPRLSLMGVFLPRLCLIFFFSSAFPETFLTFHLFMRLSDIHSLFSG